MCGIAGILAFKNKVDVTVLKQMTDTLIHRGPDAKGQWVNENKTIGLGHRRLSIIDLSDAGKQPMHYLKRYTITYNGEIYNYLEIKELLQKRGYQFNSHTDTEVILAAYDYYGTDCLFHFDGMFAFAIWDEKKQELFCARDRFGEKPFYYTFHNNQFLFGSEMKALWAIGVPKKPLRQRVYEFLLFSTLENPFNRTQTFYEGIYQLQPAHFFTLKYNSNRQPEVNQIRYWDVDISKRINISFEDAKHQFLELFSTSIKNRLRSDVPVGSSLSGGLDSSAIVCTIAKKFSDTISSFNTFSAIFPGFEKDESEYIKEVIKHTGFNNYSVTPSPETFLTRFEKLMYHQEEPYGSSSIAAQFEVMGLAKKHDTTVLLDGQGADEILAGYVPMWQTYLKQLYSPFNKNFKTQLSLFSSHYPGLMQNESFFKIMIEKICYDFIKKTGDLRRPYISPGSKFYLGIHPVLIYYFKTTKNPVYKPPNLKKHLKFVLTQRGLNELLRYADRNSMAHSVEVRLPFLSHRLVEFVLSLPEEYIIHNGWPKRLLRESMERILPEKIQWRKDKIGYEPPQQNWFENKMIQDKLMNAVEILKKEHIIKTTNSQLYWKYLMLGEIYD